jgi:ATP adenylyltransferase
MGWGTVKLPKGRSTLDFAGISSSFHPAVKPLSSRLRVMANLARLGASEANGTLQEMDILWTPWRDSYITTADISADGQSCVFCSLLRAGDDKKALIVHRAEFNFVVLNAYPYTSGHSMIVPYEHVDRLNKLPEAATTEMMALARQLESALFELYRPDGANIGMNIGKAAGAGIAGHIHMHALPRWVADANFISVIGETRVIPETLETTYARLKSKF